jgi:hypothetical protein
VQGISDLITVPGLINLDFADVRTIMKDAGSALMGIGRGSGEDRAAEAARQATASPLLEVNISGAQGVLFNITGGPGLGLFEVDAAAEIIKGTADPEANIIFGTVIDERMGDEVMITVIATGFDSTKRREHQRVLTSSAADTAAMRVRRDDRDFMRELEQQRAAAALPPPADAAPFASSSNGEGRSEADPAPAFPPPAARESATAWRTASAPRGGQSSDAGRPAQREVEDLDIPAFLRRNR